MRAESAVEPTRSENTTVTWRRSPVSWVFGSVGNIDLILGKALGVLPETELFEPVRNLLHRRSLRELIVA
jgi:hypothetical protein